MSIEKSKSHDKGVILLSGGLDSAICLSVANQECKEVYPIFFDYGQKTVEKEHTCVDALIKYFRTKALTIIDLKFLANITRAALCKQESLVTRENEYVPYRNGVFLSIATAVAETIGSDVIYIGSTGSDTICNDNSPEFRKHFEKAIEIGTNTKQKISISAPLQDVKKTGVIERGRELGTPFELTWSCHNNNDVPCKQCSNCQSRAKAFEEVGIKDPLE